MNNGLTVNRIENTPQRGNIFPVAFLSVVFSVEIHQRYCFLRQFEKIS